MGRGKHSADKEEYYFQSKNKEEQYDYEEDERSSKYKIITAIIIVVAIVIIAIILNTDFSKIGKEKTNTNNELASNNVSNQVTNEVEQKQTLPGTYQGYNVLGKIKISKIEVEQYILDSKEDGALNQGVIKLYGNSLNNYGNFCIAGHNEPGIFEKLNELTTGDTITIIEPNLVETTYEVTKIDEVEANNLECLLPNEEKVEITLITCKDGSTKRLVVKAEEKNV